MCPVEERENHSHQIGKCHATYPPDMDGDRRIWRPHISGGNMIRWMTRFNGVNRLSCIRFEVWNGQWVGKDSCFMGNLGANKNNDRSNISRITDTQFIMKQVATSLWGVTQWWWRRTEEFKQIEAKKPESLEAEMNSPKEDWLALKPQIDKERGEVS